jgi:GLPGLI family protein
MKRLLTGFTMVLIAMVTLMPLAKAQKVPFIGTVVYDVTVAGNVPEQAKSMMPTEMTMKVSPDKLITVIHSSMMDIKNIFDAPAQVSNMLMDMMGQKLNIKNSVADLNEQKKKLGLTITFKPTNDTKTIAGYNCKKAIMTVKSNQSAEQTFDVFFNDNFDVSKFNFGNALPEVDGLALEFSMAQGPFTLKMTARSVKKENIAASEFVIPAGYKQVTTEQLKTMFGGGGEQ